MPARERRETGLARILTYNVRRCLGVDGMMSPERIADVIAACRPDIVALQELDVRRARSDMVDQAREIASRLEMRHTHFSAALRILEEEYGNAILTTSPSRLVRAAPLPSTRKRGEPRGALWAEVSVGETPLQVVTTHLGLGWGERLAQTEALLGSDWLDHPQCHEPVVFLGDLNSLPRGRIHRRFAARLRDAHAADPAVTRPRATFPAHLPLLRIDHVFVSAGVAVRSAATVRTPAARLASDHLPLLVEFDLTD